MVWAPCDACEDLPTFDQPKPVPESFQNKVIEVFRRCGSREIPAKNFRQGTSQSKESRKK